ncbi:LysR substrate-binding domain-containing protein [Marinomonas sp. 2405UD68-3]|uniref:LysR substrate-binding domain-containing protein n=1 Tax=Marinomonas sp. 2405UD68-3 TaxID=3391835 RepID=UPI0039C9D7C4
MSNMNRELDVDLLRTFVAIADTGSFTKASKLVHRTQSAVSMQMKRLEIITGAPLFTRLGKNANLSPHGAKLHHYAREILKLQEVALYDLQELKKNGSISVGIPDDYVEKFLSTFINSFKIECPDVEVIIIIQPSIILNDLLHQGKVDIAIMTRNFSTQSINEYKLRNEPVFWVTSKNHNIHKHNKLPMAIFSSDCIFRTWAIEALNKKNREYKISYTSQSLLGITTFIKSGFGVSALTKSSVNSDLQILNESDGFPNLPLNTIILVKSPANTCSIVQKMEQHIINAFSE